MTSEIEIVESYRQWTPPDWVRGSTIALSESVPPRYCMGLRSIVLTNTAALTGRRKRRKASSSRGKFRSDQLLGLYHPRTGTNHAWLELFVDKIISEYPPWLLRLRVVRDTLIAKVLFHEWGHHLHYTQAPEFRDKEDVADEWVRRLRRPYFRRRYWYLVPIAALFRLAARTFGGRTS